MLINFITNIPVNECSGGHSGVNLAAYEALKEIAQVHYVGPVSPRGSVIEKMLSKSRRLLGFSGDFHFFSQRRLSRIAQEVKSRTRCDADLDFYHGITPWILSSPERPYIAWSDCSFQDYITIYHNPKLFLKTSIHRICSSEKSWMDSAVAILFSSDWALERAVRDYGLSRSRFRSVGIFGAMEPPMQDSWSGAKDFYFISTNYQQKRGGLCREAMEYVWKHYPEARLRIIGAKPPAQHLVPGKVFYEGFFRKSVPEELSAFHQHLSGAFALLHPTDADTTAMIIIEAAFFGCPAITVDDFALREVTSRANAGLLLTRPLSAQKLADKMISLLENPHYYQELRTSARAYAISSFTRTAFKSRLQEAVLDVYSKARSR